MDPTGERLILESSDTDLRNEHLARYTFAETLAKGKRVLDAGCGAAYGAARLAAYGASVYALDSAGEAVRHGRAVYSNVRFVQGDCTALPFADDSIDLVVAFEVIEHMERWSDLIREAARVLVRSGVFLVSTPNRSYYEISRNVPNPFHVHEFEYDEFRTALAATFDHTKVFFENHSPAIAFTSSEPCGARAHFEAPQPEPESAHFFVAACSMSPLDIPADLAYVPVCGNVLRARELHIAKLSEWIATLEARHAEIEGSMSRELRRTPYRILRRLRLAPRLPENWSG